MEVNEIFLKICEGSPSGVKRRLAAEIRSLQSSLRDSEEKLREAIAAIKAKNRELEIHIYGSECYLSCNLTDVALHVGDSLIEPKKEGNL